MRRVVTTALAVSALALVASSACSKPAPAFVDGMEAGALGPLPDEVAAAAPDLDSGEPGAVRGLAWSFEPPELQVYRSTAVHLRVDAFPAGREGARCVWTFGDGTPSEEGCAVSHTFHGGQADQPVRLRLVDGDWEVESTRVIPLERLSVTVAEPAADGGAGALPPKPRAGAGRFRLALIADTAGIDGLARVSSTLVDRVSPDLVLHLGGAVADEGGDPAWDLARAGVAEPLLAADVPLIWAMSSIDLREGARVRRPALELLDGESFPARYTFAHDGAFFLVISSDPARGLTPDDLRWMRAALEQAQVYDARFVVSHLPLHPFTEDGAGALNDKLKVYELLLRARVTAFFSAGHGVYFKGRYGALPVVSVGRPADVGGRLSGTDHPQPGTFAVVDVVGGAVERVFAVEGPTWDRALDEAYLPETVEVYTR